MHLTYAMIVFMRQHTGCPLTHDAINLETCAQRQRVAFGGHTTAFIGVHVVKLAVDRFAEVGLNA